MKKLQHMRKLAEKLSAGKGYVAPPEYRTIATAATLRMLAEKTFDRDVVVRNRAYGFAHS